MPKLSIMVPVYKVEKYLRQCLDSILSQTFGDFELILVNDDSPDRSPEICEEYKNNDSRVIVVHKKNGGLSDTRNAGLAVARGDYLGFVDSDDYVAPNMYETLIQTMEESDCDMVICDNYRVSSDGITVQNWLPAPKTFNRQEAMFEFLTDRIGSQAWNKLYKRELFNNIRYPKGCLYEDIPTTYKYVHRCNKIVYINVPLYYYTIRCDSLSFSNQSCYHIFAGFKDRYEFAKLEYPSFMDESLKLMAEHGLVVYYQAISSGDLSRQKEIRNYLAAQRKNILKSKSLSPKRKMQALLLIYNKPVYCWLIKCLQALRSRRENTSLGQLG